MIGMHTDFAGWTVRVDMSALLPGDDNLQTVDVKVRTLDPIHNIDGYNGCDFCCDAPAVYELDAVAVLGDGGYNTQYCQKCAQSSASAVENPDRWMAPTVTVEMVEDLLRGRGW